ncbi:hypothetical protein B0H66DRAFT_539123 [Apodospora peruviana]|uniref:Uncharacterized protein n=1 Tax=Apodospora peruviana TaxID=516989 RepID=A0AAE0LY08_9PEZI|nr:hypothetical protein B0H66DRAFT_539123 [Apodospora peruviana]
MASNAPASEAGKNGPLSFMTKLSPCVYIYRPSNTGDRSVSTPAAESVVSARTTPHQATTTPKFILLATWMGARDPHIAKYVLPYQALFPSAQICSSAPSCATLLP